MFKLRKDVVLKRLIFRYQGRWFVWNCKVLNLKDCMLLFAIRLARHPNGYIGSRSSSERSLSGFSGKSPASSYLRLIRHAQFNCHLYTTTLLPQFMAKIMSSSKDYKTTEGIDERLQNLHPIYILKLEQKNAGIPHWEKKFQRQRFMRVCT